MIHKDEGINDHNILLPRPKNWQHRNKVTFREAQTGWRNISYSHLLMQPAYEGSDSA